MTDEATTRTGKTRAGGSFVLGRDAFRKISAVEGIQPTEEALRRSAEFDRRGMTSDQRRRAIIEVHRPK